MNIFSRITARTMAQNRTRTVVTIIGVILSTAMITAVATFGSSFLQAMMEYTISREGEWHLAVCGVPADRAEALMSQEEVKRVGVITELGYALHEPLTKNSPGMPYLYVQSLSAEAIEMLPVKLEEGRMPENAGEILIPGFLPANEEEDQITKIGDTLTLELGERTYDGERLNQNNPFMTIEENGAEELFTPEQTMSFQVVGIYAEWPAYSYGGAGYDVLAGPLSHSGADGKAAGEGQQLTQTGEEPKYLDIYCMVKHPKQVYRLRKEWEGLLQETGSRFFTHDSLLRWLGVVDNDNFYKVLQGLMAILMLVIVVGSVTLIYNAFSISLRERTTQFGLLSSIGATKKQLRSSMRYEALLVCAAGIPLGILAGVGGTGITLCYVGKSIMNWIHGAQMGVRLVVLPESLAAAAAIAFLTVMISVWIPSRRIRKISPLEAIRSNTDIKIRPREVKTGSWVSAVFGLEGMLAEKNYKRDKKKYRTTVISLAMSIVLFMTAALFNIYLIRTGSFVLDAPEIDLQYTVYQEMNAEEYGRIGKIIDEMESVTGVFPYRRTHLILDIPVEYLEKNTETARQEEDGKTESGTDTEKVEVELAILPDILFEKYARQWNIDADEYENADHIRLLYLNVVRNYNPETQRYEYFRLMENSPEKLLDFGRFDYGKDNVEFRQLGQLEMADIIDTLPAELANDNGGLVALMPASLYERFSARLNKENTVALFNIQCKNPAETCEKIQKKLEESGLKAAGYLMNLTREYESDRNALAAVKVLTYGFIVLISLIAVANVFNTISTNLMLRRKEFAMLRSMGMSPRGMRKMMNYECLIYGVRAIAYGVALSLLLGAALHRVIGIGVDTRFLVPWQYLIVAVAGTFLIVFLSMLYTMRKIRKNNIVDELKMN